MYSIDETLAQLATLKERVFEEHPRTDFTKAIGETINTLAFLLQKHADELDRKSA